MEWRNINTNITARSLKRTSSVERELLSKKYVIAVSGTHGKTTTSSLVAWILKYAKLNPGYLIGGQPINFNAPAKLTNSKYLVQINLFEDEI